MRREPVRSDAFTKYVLQTGLLREIRHHGRVFQVAAWNADTWTLAEEATHFGFVASGRCELTGGSGSFSLLSGMYFSQPGGGQIRGESSGLVISRLDYQGLFQLGGPIETTGRLQYIDGCSDTLLISPVVRGEPCLNLLVIPPGTAQTAHTHPSFRAGVIVGGRGYCQLPEGRVSLEPGDAFVIEADGLHSFHTTEDSLTVIAFHPDSDFGPHRDDHPMINRTIVDGVSAAKLSLAERRIGGHHP